MTPTTRVSRLQLCFARPWRTAVAALRGDDTADAAAIEWELPDGAEAGDTYIQFVDSPAPAAVEQGVIIDALDGPTIDFASHDSFPTGISLWAIERRLGRALPSLPTTIDDPALAHQIADAVKQEKIRPTSWRQIGNHSCPPSSYPAAWPPEPHGCTCCHQPGLPLEPHEHEDDPDNLGLLFVCRQCHDRLHTPLPPDPADLIYADRPLCPSCSARRTDEVITGMPPRPSPIGYHIAGCTILGLPDDFTCQACGMFWAEDDRYFPRASAPGPDVRVRARVENQPGSPDRVDSAPYEPGRLVFGRLAENVPPPGLVPAWGPPQHVVLVGDDHRIYNVDPATVRHLDPDPEKVPFMNPPRVVTRAADELFSRLENPAGDVTLCAPFLTSEIADRLADLARNSEVDWYLLTHLDAQAVANGYQSVDGLRTLLEAGVHMVNYPKLHAKAYVIGHDFALVGSANLTAAGLGVNIAANAELSVIVPESDVNSVQQVLDLWWSHGEDIDAPRLDRLDELARRLPRFSPTAPPTTTTDTESALLEDAERDDVTLWLKAHYGPARPDTWSRESWFSTSGSTGTPSFKPGDLVAIYSQDDHSCYCIVEVTDEPRYSPDFVAKFEGADNGDRWPWVNTTAPRLIPTNQTGISLHDLGIKAQGLQGGRRRLTIDEFTNIISALNVSLGARTEPDGDDRSDRVTVDASRRDQADEFEKTAHHEPLPFKPEPDHIALHSDNPRSSDYLHRQTEATRNEP